MLQVCRTVRQKSHQLANLNIIFKKIVMFPHSVNNVIIPQMLIFPTFGMQTLIDNNLILNMKRAPRFIFGSVFCLENQQVLHLPPASRITSFFLPPTPPLPLQPIQERREEQQKSTLPLPHKCLVCGTNLQMSAKATGEYKFLPLLRNYFFFQIDDKLEERKAANRLVGKREGEREVRKLVNKE